jgi:hypothetical protein
MLLYLYHKSKGLFRESFNVSNNNLAETAIEPSESDSIISQTLLGLNLKPTPLRPSLIGIKVIQNG